MTYSKCRKSQSKIKQKTTRANKQITQSEKQAKDMNRYFSKEDIQKSNKHLKRLLFIIRELKIKTTMNYYLIHQDGYFQNNKTASDGKNLKKLEPWYTAGGNVKMVQMLWFLKKLNI